MDEAARPEFPSIQFRTEISVTFWDASVYAGLRFDPDSQDVARHLGEPFYRLPGEVDASFAHGKSTIAIRRSLMVRGCLGITFTTTQEVTDLWILATVPTTTHSPQKRKVFGSGKQRRSAASLLASLPQTLPRYASTTATAEDVPHKSSSTANLTCSEYTANPEFFGIW
ncbi:hypothetical protein DFH08DRAFT_797234 [Mycena albidolilacea]|uniref:Uncharacterized protein n=1 Tax=Mycena albidolilacea TaxID=1033008 RepID=A0AAD7AQM4_9AGAR|nr:hypothetical protein DFH08DRAFT_797234 [Mycena albidolilacea]